MKTRLCFLFVLGWSLLYSQDYNSILLNTDNGLPSEHVYCAFEDSKGYIWIGTKNGVVRWDSRNFEYYTINDGLPNNEVIYISEDSRGRIWFSSFTNEISYFYQGKIFNSKKDERLKHIRPKADSRFEEQDSFMYYLDGKNQLLRANVETLKTQLLDTSQNLNFFIIYQKQILGSKKPNSEEFDSIIHRIGIVNFTKHILIREAINFNSNRYKQISSMLVIDSIIKPYYRVKIKSNTKANYIFRVQNGKAFLINNKLELYFKNPPIDKILSDKIENVFKTRKGLSYLTSEKKIHQVSLFERPIEFYYEQSKYNLTRLENANYLACSKSIYNLNDKSKLRLTQELNIKCHFFSKVENAHYIGTGNGIYRLKDNKVFQILPSTNDQISNKVYSIFIDSRGILWYSGLDGIRYSSNYNNQILSPSTISLNPEFKVFVNEIKEDKSGNLIFATNNGVYIYHPVSKRKWWLNEKNYLTSNECNRIELDEKDNTLWVSTFKGLNHIKYTLNENSSKIELVNRFLVDDGLYSNEINDLFLQGDSIWIATSKGLNLLFAKNYRPDTIEIPIHINSFLVNEKEYQIANHIALLHSENNISIDFSAIYYQRRNRLVVKYILRKDEIVTSEKYIQGNTLSLVALENGNYTLDILAYDRDYPYIKSKNKIINFSIRPPFYKSWWFWTGLFLFFSIGVIYYIYQKMLRKKNRLIREAETQAKINEYSLKGLQGQMNPHFVFNSLNTVQHFIAKNQEREAMDYISQFSALIRKMLENGRNAKIQLEYEIKFLKEYGDLELIRFEHSFDIIFEINIEDHDMDIEIPTMLIQPLVENAIKHGVSNLSERRGFVKIQFDLIENDLQVLVIDNGGELHSLAKMPHTSTALKLIKERIDLYFIKGRKGSFELNITDQGAQAKLVIPI